MKQPSVPAGGFMHKLFSHVHFPSGKHWHDAKGGFFTVIGENGERLQKRVKVGESEAGSRWEEGKAAVNSPDKSVLINELKRPLWTWENFHIAINSFQGYRKGMWEDGEGVGKVKAWLQAGIGKQNILNTMKEMTTLSWI